MECFNCGAIIKDSRVNCPNCGYRFTAGDNRDCPNKVGPVCRITENICTMGTSFMSCPTKMRVDKEASF